MGGGTGQNGIIGLSTTGPEDGCVGSAAEFRVPLFLESGKKEVFRLIIS